MLRITTLPLKPELGIRSGSTAEPPPTQTTMQLTVFFLQNM